MSGLTRCTWWYWSEAARLGTRPKIVEIPEIRPRDQIGDFSGPKFIIEMERHFDEGGTRKGDFIYTHTNTHTPPPPWAHNSNKDPLIIDSY